jgi:hypothetical protein
VSEDRRYGRQVTIYRHRPDISRRLLLSEGVECVTVDRGQRFALEPFRCETQEYVSIVRSNSVYPEHFQVAHEFEFAPSTAELRLRVLVPGPGEIPETKSYKYAKAADEVVSTSLSQRERRDRYAGAMHQVALRSFHEVFESDRRPNQDDFARGGYQYN